MDELRAATVKLHSANGIVTPRLERLMGGELAAWIAKRHPIPGLDQLIKTAGGSREHFHLALKSGDATTHVLGWVRRHGDTLTLCVDGASVDKPMRGTLTQQVREVWQRAVQRQVSDSGFGKFIGVAVNAIRERAAADPGIKRVQIMGTQIASPHLAAMLRELGFTTDIVNPTPAMVTSWGLTAGGFVLSAQQLLSQADPQHLSMAAMVLLAGLFSMARTSGMRGRYTVDDYRSTKA